MPRLEWAPLTAEIEWREGLLERVKMVTATADSSAGDIQARKAPTFTASIASTSAADNVVVNRAATVAPLGQVSTTKTGSVSARYFAEDLRIDDVEGDSVKLRWDSPDA